MEVKKFDIDFIDRTQNLINQYSGDTEFTLLINCLLGLIILPNEFNRKRNLKYLSKNVEEIPEINEIFKSSEKFLFNPTHWSKQKRKHVKSSKTLECFLKKIRNGLAHIDTLIPLNENGKWIGIKIMDINKGNNNNIELEMTLTYDEIKRISNYISNGYKMEVLNIS